MNQYAFENNQLKIKVLKSPILVRFILFIITFLCFALPLFGIIFTITEGNGIKFGGIIAFGLFCLLGFYLLRISLWNNHGEETIHFKEKEIMYIANYGWFKDGKKSLDRTELLYIIKSVGYVDERSGVLIISNGKSEIESVVKMPVQQLEKLIVLIQNSTKH